MRTLLGHGPLRGARASASLLFAVVVAVALVSSGCEAASPDPGPAVPAGAGFYAVDQETVTGAPGKLLQAQPVTPEPVRGARTWRVLYVSRDGAGLPVAVSGMVSIPSGAAPKAGWPVISYGHATTGVADRCAPSRAGLDRQTLSLVLDRNRVIAEFVTDGFVVAQSDYEGLGTPGGHPYLDGRSEARGMIDIVRTAAALNEHASTRWVALGYSQGAKAAVWAGDLARTYGQGLQLRGTVGIAPPHLTAATDTATYLAQSEADTSSTYLAMVLSGAAAEDPTLDVQQLLTPQGWLRYQYLATMCVGGLIEDPAGPAGLTPSKFFHDARALQLIEKRDRDTDAGNADPAGPVLLLSGEYDDHVPLEQVAELADVLRIHGANVTYRNYDWANHSTLLYKALPDIHTWITDTIHSG